LSFRTTIEELVKQFMTKILCQAPYIIRMEPFPSTKVNNLILFTNPVSWINSKTFLDSVNRAILKPSQPSFELNITLILEPVLYKFSHSSNMIMNNVT
jgi:hypothetical protein